MIKLRKIIKNNSHTFLFLFSFIVLNLYIGTKISKKINYQENFIRLHVVANSNSIPDQIDKLKVAEKVNSYISSLNIPSNTSKEDLLTILNSNSNEILNIANNTTNSTSTLKIGKINYEEKQSLTYDMPSGSYDSMQLILGNGNGKNIWSFIFPNEENLKNIQNFETILPGISDIYTNNTSSENEDNEITYSIKLLEVLKSII